MCLALLVKNEAPHGHWGQAYQYMCPVSCCVFVHPSWRCWVDRSRWILGHEKADPNNRLRAPENSRGGEDSAHVSCWETHWMNSFWCLLFSPPCLPTDILSFNSSAAWRAMEGAWERVGGKDGERKKVCFSIKRLSRRLGGIHWLFDVLFDDAFLFYELNDTHNSSTSVLAHFSLFTVLARCLARSLSLISTLCRSLFPLLHAPSLLSLIITCLLFCNTHTSLHQLVSMDLLCETIFWWLILPITKTLSPQTINFSWRGNCISQNH